eukprot:TRINITY_DN622_c0_g1_i1.p1 TRINITY_DN622_c0_g1~~TRINITY_DN622_c0_g1_i1.p1  ORF type:complete len:122 (+),score=5.53 TRINITY_DN622_c0_g1_i1:42-368(+)
MNTKKFTTLKDFYPFYLSEHANPTNRLLHFIGTSFVVLIFFWTLFFTSWKYFILVPIFGYSFAWVGHFFFEKNIPATFSYPFFSLASDFIMWWSILTGKLTLTSHANK